MSNYIRDFNNKMEYYYTKARIKIELPDLISMFVKMNTKWEIKYMLKNNKLTIKLELNQTDHLKSPHLPKLCNLTNQKKNFNILKSYFE